MFTILEIDSSSRTERELINRINQVIQLFKWLILSPSKISDWLLGCGLINWGWLPMERNLRQPIKSSQLPHSNLAYGSRDYLIGWRKLRLRKLRSMGNQPDIFRVRVPSHDAYCCTRVFAYRSFDQSLMFRRFTYASILFYCPMQRIARKRINRSPITESFC